MEKKPNFKLRSLFAANCATQTGEICSDARLWVLVCSAVRGSESLSGVEEFQEFRSRGIEDATVSPQRVTILVQSTHLCINY